jgi:hypothetical protein
MPGWVALLVRGGAEARSQATDQLSVRISYCGQSKPKLVAISAIRLSLSSLFG